LFSLRWRSRPARFDRDRPAPWGAFSPSRISPRGTAGPASATGRGGPGAGGKSGREAGRAPGSFLRLSNRYDRRQCPPGFGETYFSFCFFSSTFKCGNTNAARTGGGIGDFGPFTDRQMTSLKRRSSARSSCVRSNDSDNFAPQASDLFFSLRSTSGTACLYVAKSGVAWKAWYIGRAAASNWLIGLSPRISSIVRSMLAVEYIVESTNFRFV